MSGMVNFLAGLGGGMLQGHAANKREAREKKDDEFREEQRGRQRKEWADADRLETDLKDAAAPRTTMEGTVTEAGGNKFLNVDPAQASAVQDTLAAEAELKGEAAPTQQAGTGIVGGMAKGNEITTGPVDVAKLNSPDARNERVAGALRKNGQIERAMTMENSVLDQTAKRLGLEVAQVKFADEQFNRKLTERLSASPDWTQGAAQVLTDTAVGGLKDVNVTPRASADGKSVQFVGVGQDGKERVLGTFENSPAGMSKFMQTVSRAPVEAKIGWIVEGAKAEKEDQRWQQTFDFNKKKEENDQQYRQRVLSIQMAQEGRAAAVHRTAMEDAKIPPAVKLQAQTLAKQMETINGALSKAMAEGSFDPNNASSADLIKQQRILGLKYQNLLSRYTPGAEKGADPLGMGAPGGEQGAPAQAAPAQGQPQAGAPAAPPRAAPMQAATQPVDVLRGRVIGPLTSMADIQQSAQAGNQEAIAYLQRRAQGQADTAAAPRTAAEMLNR